MSQENKYLTLLEVMSKKKKIEEEINVLLNDFENQTNTKIIKIDIQKIHLNDKCSRTDKVTLMVLL